MSEMSQINRRALAAAIAGALTVPMTAIAVESNFYGHVNREILFLDDGEASDVQFLDNTAYSTRFGWRGSADMGNGITAGARIEMATQSNLGGGSTKLGDNGDFSIRLRQSYVWFSGNWGTLSLGQASDSLDGVAFSDLSGAWMAAENYPDHGGLAQFRDDTTGAYTSLIVYHIFASFDGARRDLVKYDSPAFGPVSISTFAATNNAWGVNANLDTELAGGQLWAQLGYMENQPEFNRSVVSTAGSKTGTLTGSISYKFSQGTNIMFAYGTNFRDEDNFGIAGSPGSGTAFCNAASAAGQDCDDPEHWYVALGHDWGNNSVRVQYQETDDFILGCSGESIGVGFNHSIPKPKVDLYTGYHNYSADCNDVGAGQIGATTGDLQDIDVFMVGAKVAFD
jgi:predicted porin